MDPEKVWNEILSKVFVFLSKSELFSCVTVSKNWNQLVLPILWETVTPKYNALKPIHSRIYERYYTAYPNFPIHLSYYGKLIKELYLSDDTAVINPATVHHIIRFCPNITKLHLSHCRISDSKLRTIAHSSIAEQLHTFTLEDSDEISDSSLCSLSNNCLNLETLSLKKCTMVTNHGIGLILFSCGKTLKHIGLSDCPLLTPSLLQSITRYCGSRLLTLNLDGFNFKQREIAQLTRECPNITELKISPKTTIFDGFEYRDERLGVVYRSERREMMYMGGRQVDMEDFLRSLEGYRLPVRFDDEWPFEVGLLRNRSI